jgi:hypothetical protein
MTFDEGKHDAVSLEAFAEMWLKIEAAPPWQRDVIG